MGTPPVRPRPKGPNPLVLTYIQILRNVAVLVVGARSYEVGAPLRENPGSSTAVFITDDA